MAHMEFEEKRYCVEAVFVDPITDTTTTYRHFFDSFFDAVERAKRYVDALERAKSYGVAKDGANDVNIFDYAAGRTLFDLSDLD